MGTKVTVKNGNQVALAILLVIGLETVVLSANAQNVTMGLSTLFGSQTVPPASSMTPWVSAVFQNNGDGTVNLTIQAPNLTGVEDIGTLYLNFDESYNSVFNGLKFTAVSSTGGFDATKVTFSPFDSSNYGKQRADGDGFYDVLINVSSGANAFVNGDSLTWKISSSNGSVSASDFEVQSDPGGGSGTYYAAAHVMNTPNTSGTGGAWMGASTFAVAPESTATGIGAGLLGLGVSALRMKRGLLAKS